MREFRIMASLVGRSNPGLYGSSKLSDIRVGWFWGIFEVFGSKRNKKPLTKKQIKSRKIEIYHCKNNF